MSMPRLLRRRDALRLLAATVLFGWVLRALVPAGFMPSSGSVPGSLPGLVICTQGMPHGVVPGAGQQLPDTVADMLCVVGSHFTQLAMPGPSGAILLALALWFVIFGRPRCKRAHAVRAPGPPVGSRAPPSRSAFSLLCLA